MKMLIKKLGMNVILALGVAFFDLKGYWE